MRFYFFYLPIFLFISLSCQRWDYKDPSNPVETLAPETHLSLIALDTIWVAPQVGETGDTTLFYLIDYYHIQDLLKN